MKTLITATALILSMGGTAIAQDLSGPVKARQGQFNIMAINLGILGAMAKGEAEYDAAAAQAAADTLVAISMVNQAPLWPAGSDNGSLEGTRALPAIMENFDDFATIWASFGEGAMAMQAAAGGGAQAIGGATVSYTHLRAHETVLDLVCRLLLEKKHLQHNLSLRHNSLS